MCWYKTCQSPLKWQELLSLACSWPVGMNTLPIFQGVMEIQICMGILWWLKRLSTHAHTLFCCWQLISIETSCRQNKACLWPWWLPVFNTIGLFFHLGSLILDVFRMLVWEWLSCVALSQSLIRLGLRCRLWLHHLKAWLKREDSLPRWLPHKAGGLCILHWVYLRAAWVSKQQTSFRASGQKSSETMLKTLFFHELALTGTLHFHNILLVTAFNPIHCRREEVWIQEVRTFGGHLGYPTQFSGWVESFHDLS